MKFLQALGLMGLILGHGTLVAPATVPTEGQQLASSAPTDPALKLSKDSFAYMDANYKLYTTKELLSRSLTKDTCNIATVHVRREWGSMSKATRKDYIRAVKCLASNPPKSDPVTVSGARSRFDDFVAAHILEAYKIHFNGHLFAWHRAFVWEYENALINECGYKGTHPYWDWTKYYKDPASSPIFDGSDTSLGSNGEFFPHGDTILKAFGLQLTLPAGTGGGAVYKGPFANFTVNLGLTPPDPEPASRIALPIPANNTLINNNKTEVKVVAAEGLTYNPRPLTRDINLQWSAQTKTSDVEHVLKCQDVDCLEKTADGWIIPGGVAQPLLHAAGHFTIGGLANDPFASPGDPAFYLHHGQFDRVWSIWQAQDPTKRTFQVGGTITPLNTPPSQNVTLQDVLEFPAVGPNYTMSDAMNPIGGKFCYMYL